MYLNKKHFLYLVFSLSLFIGFLFDENSSGGAKLDYEYLFPFIENFKHDFLSAIDLFAKDSGALIHSPVFYILIGKAHNFFFYLNHLKIFYIIISCGLPYIFYLVLKERYQNNHDFCFYFSLIIFISPYFRSSAIWLLGDNLSLIFFCLSVYFINKQTDKSGNFTKFFFSLFFLSLCCYIRYYYSIFSIFYFYFFYRNLEIKKFYFLIFVAFILSIPALTYFFYIVNNYDFINKLTTYSNLNLYSNSLVILSIILFYLIPFLIIRISQFKLYLGQNIKLITYFFLFFSFIFCIDSFLKIRLIYFSELGGGIFMKIALLFSIQPSLFLSLFSFLSLVILDFFFQGNKIKNYFLLILLILAFPIFTLYQKYFDPLLLIFFFGLIKSKQIEKTIEDFKKNLSIIYLYFFSFYVFSIFYYS
tara:strand:+ start:553 stop:1803 length:1251 start_codon:yes stop_codon:yes gene_type:complete